MKQRTILAIVIMTIMLAPLYAQSESDFDVVQNRDNTITITGYIGTVKDVVIPSTLYGLRVTHIGERAFRNMRITGVVIPNTIISIGRYAFEGNEQLTVVTFPNSVIEIEINAFSGCGLTKINFGMVQTIGEGAFMGNNLTELTLPASLKFIGIGAFNTGGYSTNIGHRFDYYSNKNQIKFLTIPNGVTFIGEYAFAGNPIETLVIPQSLAERTYTKNIAGWPVLDMGIGRNAFGDLKNLARVTLPANMHNDAILGGNEIDLYFGVWAEAAGPGLPSIGFEQSLVNFYISQNKAAGTYVKNGPIWTRESSSTSVSNNTSGNTATARNTTTGNTHRHKPLMKGARRFTDRATGITQLSNLPRLYGSILIITSPTTSVLPPTTI